MENIKGNSSGYVQNLKKMNILKKTHFLRVLLQLLDNQQDLVPVQYDSGLWMFINPAIITQQVIILHNGSNSLRFNIPLHCTTDVFPQ